MKKFLFVGLLFSAVAFAGQPPVRLTREQVLDETLKPYMGPSRPGVDTSTLNNKVVCGYQGWFNVDGDGSDRGWIHWTKDRKPLNPTNANIDLWPDVSELSKAERVPTGFKHTDGRVAEVFSSHNRATVLRHFQWMRDYGIDAAFVQRFVSGLRDPRVLRHNNVVLNHCREGANQSGRGYSVMYDLSGLKIGKVEEVMEDWRLLRTRMRITNDPAYIRHRGKPVVTLWGVGFGDKRDYTLEECRQLIEFLKKDGCTVMIGVPTYWRLLKNDAVKDPALHEVMKLADIVSPWTVGRYRNPADAEKYAAQTQKPDIEWCQQAKLDYMPVIYPGFSWHNMKGAPLDQIPRLRGELFWCQIRAAKQNGANMLYVAMFDEVDEGTAIFKCTNDVPKAEGAEFLTYEGLPSDHYLKLAGAAGRMLRGQIPPDAPMPQGKAK